MEISLNELKEMMQSSGKENSNVWKIGAKYIIRTVTMTQVGMLKVVTDKELVLSDASWVADTGRFHEALKTGSFSEVEPFTAPVIIGRGAIVDAQEVLFELPKTPTQ